MTDHPLPRNSQESKTMQPNENEELYQSLPRFSDIAPEEAAVPSIEERIEPETPTQLSSRFSAPESLVSNFSEVKPTEAAAPAAQKPETSEPIENMEAFEVTQPASVVQPTAMPRPASEDRPTTATPQADVPVRPTAAAPYVSNPATPPVRPTAAAPYASNPATPPVRPTATAPYASNPATPPVRPAAAAPYASDPTVPPVRPSAGAPYTDRPPISAPYASRPTAATPYVSRPTAPPAKPASPKKPKKKRMGWRIALVALVCALLGSALGGGMVGYYFEHYKTDHTVETTLESTQETQPTTQQTQLQTPTTGTPVISQPTTTLSQLYSDAVPSIVGVTNEYTAYSYFGQPSTATATGTGFIISEDGEILTNYHVVEGAEKLTVTLHDGTEHEAQLLGYEAESDVALLKIEATGLTAVTLGNSDALYVGEQIAAIGNPLGELTYTMTVGYVSAKGRAVYTDEMPINMMQIDAAINSGNSGGPLFNLAGEVVGITTAKYSGSVGGSASIEGIGFAIPINDVLSILDDLREYGSVQNRAYIGVTVTNSAAGGDIPSGALVQSVEKNSSGDKAGLRVSDIITAVGETPVYGIDTLYQALRPYRAGDAVTLTVFRSGETIQLTITFDAAPQSDTEVEEQPTEEQTTQEETYGFPWDYFIP